MDADPDRTWKPVNTFFPCLAINHFREFTVKVLNLRYAKGSIDEYSFDVLKESIKYSD